MSGELFFARRSQPDSGCGSARALPLDGVGLAPSRQPAATLVRSIRFGFSWPLAISLRRPLLMSVGLSWISLDSLVNSKAKLKILILRRFRPRFPHPKSR